MPDAAPISSDRSALDEAARSALERWRGRYADAIPPSEIEASMKVIVEEGSRPPGSPLSDRLLNPSSLLVVRRALLDLLRAAFLGMDGSTPPPHRLGVVRRLEEIRDALDPDWDTQIEAGLMGPSAQEMLAEVGHDLRSPLTSVLFLSEVLKEADGIRDNEHQTHQLGLIYSAAFTMYQIVSNFVEMSQSGDRVLQPPSPFSVLDLVDTVRHTVQPLADDKGLALLMEADIENSDRRLGHPVAISRILLNLVTNAIKFTDRGQIIVRVVEDPADACTGLVFHVIDTGPGIPEETASAIFNVFEPSQDRSGLRFSGSGLGLVIVRKLLRSLGSQLSWESEPNRGTHFHFRLDLPVAPSGAI